VSNVHVTVLSAARARIVSGENTLICYALDAVSTRQTFKASREIKNHINMLLNGNSTLDFWMVLQVGGYEYYRHSHEKRIKLMRDARLRWIDWLIEEWKDAP
jgi:hypothetical protein